MSRWTVIRTRNGAYCFLTNTAELTLVVGGRGRSPLSPVWGSWDSRTSTKLPCVTLTWERKNCETRFFSSLHSRQKSRFSQIEFCDKSGSFCDGYGRDEILAKSGTPTSTEGLFVSIHHIGMENLYPIICPGEGMWIYEFYEKETCLSPWLSIGATIKRFAPKIERSRSIVDNFFTIEVIELSLHTGSELATVTESSWDDQAFRGTGSAFENPFTILVASKTTEIDS
jgi:hypothetical protein